MKLKLDENLPVELVEDIQALGHDAETVYSESLVGFPDAEILSVAKSEGRAVLTMDKGVADVRQYPPDDYAGIVLFRYSKSGRRALLEFIRPNLPRLLDLDLKGRLLVVSETGIRIR